MMLKYTLSETVSLSTDNHRIGERTNLCTRYTELLRRPWVNLGQIEQWTPTVQSGPPGGRAHQFMKLDYYTCYLQTLSIIEWIFWPEGQIRGSDCCLDQRVCRNRFPTGQAILMECVLTIWLKDLTSVAPMTLCCTMLILIVSWLSLLTLVRN